MIHTDVCIVGAGPGGAAAALKLSYLGIPCVLVDKAVFPRDKICGDAISGKVTTLLDRLDPAILERFRAKATQADVWGITFVAPNLKSFAIPFQPNYTREKAAAPGYVAKRLDFDQFLIEEVRRRDNIRLVLNTPIARYERTEQGFLAENEDRSFQVSARMLIVANGAHSSFSRHYAGLKKEPRHYAGAVRAYYKNVAGLSEDNFLELHYLKGVTPGYFWIFPLPDGYANVGLGLRTDVIARRKVNLQRELDRIIQTHPALAERFRNAELDGPVKGYGLPLGSKKRILSGDHYLLVGDAAHLIDPLTGEGIGNAFYSGFMAAEQAWQCLEQNDFSAAFLRAYDVRVDRVIGSELRLSYKLQKMLAYPWLVNLLAYIISNNQRILNFFSRMYVDFDVREQLVKPVFWLKMFFYKFRS
jgi:geranylgeranyl reductase family protein